MVKKLDIIKEDMQKEEEHMKRYSVSLAIGETQIIIRMSYHYTHVKMAKRKSTVLNAKDVKQPINCW